ncbi:MAG: SPOR domain-containing protein [Sulfurimicrobium sp.]|nr:SPOR domain-containing protein [Sulfurimicrobium sp.]
MSRDYKPAPKSTSSKKSGSPMLAGIFIGMFIGLAIALAVAVVIKGSPSPFLEHKSEPPASDKTPLAPTTPAEKPAEDKPKAADKPRFDFYTILPGTEEPVTEKDIKQQDSESAAKSQYYLQAGAFQNEGEADNLKAKLALIGVEATIQTVTVPDKGVWHRVRVGPYNSVDDLNRMRATLIQNGVSASLVKVHDQAH